MYEEFKEFLQSELEKASKDLIAEAVGPFLAGRASGRIQIIKETLKKIEEIEVLAKKTS
jgi:hypothetical protein